MGSAAVAIAALLAGATVPASAAQDMPPSASPQDSALYRYLDDADALLDAIGTSPPDYGFRFEALDCWAWAMSDGYLVLAEPLDQDYRFYVFAPGDDHPLFVGDRDYAYGFEGRALVAVYGANGALVRWSPSDATATDGAWLSERGFRMKRALQNRQPVVAPDWADSIGWFGGLVLRFDSWRDQPDWLRYRGGRRDERHRDWRRKLEGEGARRRHRSDWFDRWRRDGFRGPTPRGEGSWTTRPPGGRPGKHDGKGDGDRNGGRTGGTRPTAPPTPGSGAGVPRSDDGVGRPGRGPRPGGERPGRPAFPSGGKPAAPTPVPMPVAPAPTPTPTLPPPVIVAPPEVTAPPPAPPRPGRPPDRPFRPRTDRPVGDGRPPFVKSDRGRESAPLPPAPPPPVAAPPTPPPPPVSVVPRRDPISTPPRVRVLPPSPPPVPARAPPPPPPPPPSVGRAVVPLPSVRPATAPAPRPRPERPRAVGKDKED
jgi:hypothetical protein